MILYYTIVMSPFNNFKKLCKKIKMCKKRQDLSNYINSKPKHKQKTKRPKDKILKKQKQKQQKQQKQQTKSTNHN